MLILEGTDLVGKTTAAKTLQRLLTDVYDIPCWVSHLSKPANSWKSPDDYLRMIQPGCIQDRFYHSEIAYAKMRGENPKFNHGDIVKIENALHTTCCVKVLITLQPSQFAERFKKRANSEMYNLAQIIEAQEHFKAMAYQFDYVLGCDQYMPYPTEKALNTVAEYYNDLLRQWRKVC